MMSVPRPPRQVRITKINGEDADVFDGTLRALDFVEIEGEVLDESGSMRDSSFNGKALASLFDKPLNKQTLNNKRKGDRKSTRLNSSHVASSYAVFCLKKQ